MSASGINSQLQIIFSEVWWLGSLYHVHRVQLLLRSGRGDVFNVRSSINLVRVQGATQARACIILIVLIRRDCGWVFFSNPSPTRNRTRGWLSRGRHPTTAPNWLSDLTISTHWMTWDLQTLLCRSSILATGSEHMLVAVSGENWKAFL